MEILIDIVLLVVMGLLYWVKRKFLDAKLGKIVGAVIWCVPFVIYSIIIKETGFQFIEKTYSSIVYIILGIAAQAAMIAYGNNVIPEEKNDKIYNYFVRPVTSESVFMGVLIPSLFMIKAMADFFFGNDMFFLNGAMIVAIILYVAVEIYESEQGMDMLDIVLTVVQTYIHAALIVRMGFVWINLALRIVYGVMRFIKSNKKVQA